MKDYAKINYELNKLNLLYKNSNNCCISFICTDNPEIRKYIEDYIPSIVGKDLEKEIIFYDFYQNGNNSIKKFSSLCVEDKNLVIVSGMQKYAKYLEEKQIIDKAENFYMNIFCLPRDGFYLKNKVKLILIVNSEEYKIFNSDYCDDFTSYASMKIFIDEILKENSDDEIML